MAAVEELLYDTLSRSQAIHRCPRLLAAGYRVPAGM